MSTPEQPETARVEAERKVHELKTWPDYFVHLLDGSKTFEYRRDDRGFKVGDVLHLREWEPLYERYTGREMRRTVTYLLPVSINPRFVVMALLAEREAAPSACTWKTRDGGTWYQTSCGRSFAPDGDLDGFNFCYACGKPLAEEGTR